MVLYLGLELKDTKIDQLGKAGKVTVTKDSTTIVEGAGSKEAIAERVDQIKKQIADTTSDFDREKLQERLAKLAGGVAVIVETLTDNKNRTAGDIRHHFDKCGGQMGTSGCVSYMFDKKGLIVVDMEGHDEDEIMEIALEAGADDVQVSEDVCEIYTEPSAFSEVNQTLEANASLNILEASISMIPQNTVTPDDAIAAKVRRLIDMLEDNDDVQNVYHNAELPEEDEE